MDKKDFEKGSGRSLDFTQLKEELNRLAALKKLSKEEKALQNYVPGAQAQVATAAPGVTPEQAALFMQMLQTPQGLSNWSNLVGKVEEKKAPEEIKKIPFTEEDQWRMKEAIPGLYILGEGGVDSDTTEGAYEEAIQDALDLQDEDNIRKAEAERVANFRDTLKQALADSDKRQLEKAKNKIFWDNFNSPREFEAAKNFAKDFATGFAEGIGKGTEIEANAPIEAIKAFWNTGLRKGLQDLASIFSDKILKGEWVTPGQGGGSILLPENFQFSGLATKPGEWLFNALNKKEQNDITARKQERAKAAAEKVFAQNAIAPVGTSEVSTTAKTGKVARRLNNGIPEDARVKWSDVKGAVDKLQEKPEAADDARWYDAFSAIGNAIGTWAFDPKTGSLTKTESNGPSIDDIIAGNAKRRLEGEELEQKRSQANANALLDLMKLQEPRSLGGSTIYDPASGEYHQTESALTQAIKGQLLNQQVLELQNKMQSNKAFGTYLASLSPNERNKVIAQMILSHKAGMPFDVITAAFGG